jgi:RNA polymerase primary sigma factor
VDAEFGRTTDPVRMYMREMGTVDLLTREGEIKIAKRIEEGIHQVLASLSSYPGTIQTLLEAYEFILQEEIKLTDVVVGFNDTEEYPDEGIVVRNPTEINESDEDEEEEEVVILTPEDFKEHIVKLKKLHTIYTKSIKRNGKDHGKTKIAEENLAQLFLELRLAPKFIDLLVEKLSDLIEHIRLAERYIMKLWVKESKMPRRDFITSFSGNETNLKWIKNVLKNQSTYAENLKEREQMIIDCQKKLAFIFDGSLLEIAEMKEINRRVSIGEAKARRAKKEMVEANLRLVISIAKK